MDTDRFWDLIERARRAAGPAADAAVREQEMPDDDPAHDYWDFDELDADVLRANLEPLAADASSDPGIDGASDGDWGDDEEDLTDPIAVELVGLLAQLEPSDIARFEVVFDGLRESADRVDVANAATLIEHGFLGDDSFEDFQAGLVALGRSAFEAAVRDPDSLADHPAVREIADAADPRWLGREDLLYAAGRAYAEATGRDEVSFFDAVEALDDLEPEPPSAEEPVAWSLEDEAETRRRLPRLSALFYERSMANRARALARLSTGD